MARDQFRSIAAAQLAGLVLGFLAVMMPKYFSDHCFSGLEVVLTRYGYFFLFMATQFALNYLIRSFMRMTTLPRAVGHSVLVPSSLFLTL